MITIKPMKFMIGKNNILLNNKEINIPKGITYLIGENGSGKTVFIKSIMNMFKDNSEYISYDDFSYEHVKNSVRAIFDDSYFLSKLSGIKNLKYFNNFSDQKINLDRIEEVYYIWNKKTNIPFCKYSLGMKKRLAISYALMYEPNFLFMDEPFNGLDIVAKEMLLKVIKQLKEENKTVIVSSHDPKDMFSICDNILLINNQEVKFYTNVKERLDKYLGYYIKVGYNSELDSVKDYIIDEYDEEDFKVIIVKDKFKDLVFLKLNENNIDVKDTWRVEPSFLNIMKCLEE